MGFDLTNHGGSYSIGTWGLLMKALDLAGVDIFTIPTSNDGDEISPEKCNEIADALFTNVEKIIEVYGPWAEPLPVGDITCEKNSLQFWLRMATNFKLAALRGGTEVW